MNNKYLFYNRKKGMAIMIVLCVAGVILMLGTVYIKSYTGSSPSTKLQLDHIQADFFAKGIQNIAVFKIKKFPDYFIRYYRQLVHYERGDDIFTDPGAGAGRKKLDNSQITEMSYSGGGLRLGLFTNGVLMNENLPTGFKEPLDFIDNYQTEIRLINSQDFNSEAIEITVRIIPNDKPVMNYKTIFGGDYKAQ